MLGAWTPSRQDVLPDPTGNSRGDCLPFAVLLQRLQDCCTHAGTNAAALTHPSHLIVFLHTVFSAPWQASQ